MTISTLEAARANCSSDYSSELCNYSGSTYICDAISFIADANTSIYYADIIKFISGHVEEVNDAIAEFGWDGCGSDLYKAGQMAEYCSIEREISDDLQNAVRVYAANYLRDKTGTDELDRATWECICDDLENIDDNDYLSAIEDVVNNWIDAEEDTADVA